MKSFRRNELMKRREFIELLGDAMAPCGARCRLPAPSPEDHRVALDTEHSPFLSTYHETAALAAAFCFSSSARALAWDPTSLGLFDRIVDRVQALRGHPCLRADLSDRRSRRVPDLEPVPHA